MPQTGLVVYVPEAEERFGELRRRFDPQAQLGVPAHITVLFPFIDPGSIGARERAALTRTFGELAQFPFVLAGVRRFPATTYLALESPDPFVALTNAVVRRFPEYLPYGGAYESLIPHLTVADGNAASADEAEFTLRELMQAHGPINALCTSVALLENSSGHWRQMHEFPLGRNPG